MATSFYCHCPERQKPVKERNWVVIDYKCNYSRFNGSRYTPSEYSCLQCHSCGAVGRTKAKYVDQIRNGSPKTTGFTHRSKPG